MTAILKVHTVFVCVCVGRHEEERCRREAEMMRHRDHDDMRRQQQQQQQQDGFKPNFMDSVSKKKMASPRACPPLMLVRLSSPPRASTSKHQRNRFLLALVQQAAPGGVLKNGEMLGLCVRSL